MGEQDFLGTQQSLTERQLRCLVALAPAEYEGGTRIDVICGLEVEVLWGEAG